MFQLIVVNLATAILYYTNGFKHGLSARKWVSLGLVGGVFVAPLYMAEKRMSWIKGVERQQRVYRF